jgi:predicted alpha-1,2-mannosidase
MGDYGDFSLMPMTGRPQTDWRKRASSFQRSSEIIKPYYYAVTLDKYKTKVEMTSTTRCGHLRITFPPSEPAYLSIHAHPQGAFIQMRPQEKKVYGFTRANNGGVPENFACYFVMAFDQPFSCAGLSADSLLHQDQQELAADQVFAFLRFAPGKSVTVRIATSFISLEQAEQNLAAEIGDRSFISTRNRSRNLWEKELQRIEIQGATTDQQVTFYTALYRVLLFPRIWYEFDAQGACIISVPMTAGSMPARCMRTTASGILFVRCIRFFTILFPDRDAEIIRGWINAYREGGWFPKWSSPGIEIA